MPQTRLEASVYNTAAWRKVRRLILERDEYVCAIGLPGCRGKATQVDHIVPIRAGGDHFSPANLRASCDYCNTARQITKTKRNTSREWI